LLTYGRRCHGKFVRGLCKAQMPRGGVKDTQTIEGEMGTLHSPKLIAL
jgi:hypothetical protein